MLLGIGKGKLNDFFYIFNPSWQSWNLEEHRLGRLEAGKLAVGGELDGFDVLREHGVFDVIFTLDELCCHAQSADVFQSVETVK